MINPQTLKLDSLPSLPLAHRKHLPECPGIYFAIDSQGIIYYIGRSVNLNQRWTQHHRTKQLQQHSEIKIAYLEVSEIFLLPKIEEALIEWFNPPLNGLRDNPSATDKCRVSTYITEDLKIELEKLAKVRDRSLSNLIERIIKQEIAQAKAKGEIQ